MQAVLRMVSTDLTRAFGPGIANRVMGFVNGFRRLAGIGRQVASVIGGALGRAFSFLGRHMDTVMAAAKGIAVAIGAFLAWGVITAIVTGLGAALGLLLSPILLIAGAAALLGPRTSSACGMPSAASLTACLAPGTSLTPSGACSGPCSSMATTSGIGFGSSRAGCSRW
jgi:hypothetical protein